MCKWLKEASYWKIRASENLDHKRSLKVIFQKKYLVYKYQQEISSYESTYILQYFNNPPGLKATLHLSCILQ